MRSFPRCPTCSTTWWSWVTARETRLDHRAVASVGDSDLDRVHSATTSAMLSGKLPGLSFRQADGRPGSGATIQVRNFGADPLFVIDGVPQDKGAFDQLAPNRYRVHLGAEGCLGGHLRSAGR